MQQIGPDFVEQKTIRCKGGEIKLKFYAYQLIESTFST